MDSPAVTFFFTWELVDIDASFDSLNVAEKKKFAKRHSFYKYIPEGLFEGFQPLLNIHNCFNKIYILIFKYCKSGINPQINFLIYLKRNQKKRMAWF